MVIVTRVSWTLTTPTWLYQPITGYGGRSPWAVPPSHINPLHVKSMFIYLTRGAHISPQSRWLVTLPQTCLFYIGSFTHSLTFMDVWRLSFLMYFALKIYISSLAMQLVAIREYTVVSQSRRDHIVSMVTPLSTQIVWSWFVCKISHVSTLTSLLGESEKSTCYWHLSLGNTPENSQLSYDLHE